MIVQREKQKKAGTSSLTIGNGLEICPSSQVVASVEKEQTCPSSQDVTSVQKELSWYPFFQYKARNHFGPFHEMKKVDGEIFKHRPNLEDYWANATNSFEIRRRLWFGLPLNLIRVT